MLQHDSQSRGLADAYTIPGLAETLWRIGFPIQVGFPAAAYGRVPLASKLKSLPPRGAAVAFTGWLTVHCMQVQASTAGGVEAETSQVRMRMTNSITEPYRLSLGRLLRYDVVLRCNHASRRWFLRKTSRWTHLAQP